MRKGEMLSRIFGIGLVFVMVGSMVGGLPALVKQVEASPGTIYVPDNFTTIQQAVNAASSGDTIIVRDGTYHENVVVNTANLTIQSENGTANCVVNASDTSDHVFNVTADWVNITGFTVENATGFMSELAGIYLDGVNHCNISSNNVTNNDDGIYLYSSSNNKLSNNTCSNNTYDGISLYSFSNNNTLTNNTASNNNNYGISLYSSSNNNTLTDNIASNNDYRGIRLCSSSNSNTLDNNTANENTYDGIALCSSSNSNTLANNTANSNNGYGIKLSSSSNNTLTNNTANSNHYGIHLVSSSNNTIYNNYFNNTNNAYDDGTNTWNTTKTPGTNIIGGPYLGGNYWSDYTGNDTNGDGLGDTQLPYNCSVYITNGGDYLPLVPPAPPPVGGTAYPVNKLAILAPWIALAVLLAGVLSWLTLRRRRAQS